LSILLPQFGVATPVWVCVLTELISFLVGCCSVRNRYPSFRVGVVGLLAASSDNGGPLDLLVIRVLLALSLRALFLGLAVHVALLQL